jgi:acetylornithine aminotransferase/acetylornithine/N-succinyldiaminopimelate aminotransferase
VASVRGRGLMVAAEVTAEAPKLASRALLEQRLIINATGATTLRFLPPLVVGVEEIDEAVDRLSRLDI